ncbi:MAG: cell wall hydrolase [Alphaproteobacteria bacterium]|nr:cell wall hydrolase [Alphaproteobacteria bacterium]
MPRDDDVWVLAQTLWGEARGDGLEGIEAVACVIINRFRAKKWFTGYKMENGVKIAGVKETCQKRFQFSCWNKNDPNYQKLLRVDENDASFVRCLNVAKKAIAGKMTDFTNNATFYHTKNIKPKWALHHAPCYETKGHFFYKDIK